MSWRIIPSHTRTPRARTRPPRTRGPRRGFTLVSVIVAMLLLMIGVMALATANGSTVMMQGLAQNRTNAIALARGHMEVLRTRDPWSLQSEPEVRLEADGRVSANGPYARSVEVTAVRNNLVRVEVRMRYPRATQPLVLVTSVFRGNGLSGAS